MRAAIVTAVYDAYDTVKPPLPQRGADVEWICVTDDPASVPAGWRAVHEPRPGVPAVRAAKRAKLEPWWYTNAPASVWIDASYRVTSPDFVTEALAFADPIAQFVHPWRDCVWDEAKASLQLAKYAGEPIAAQMEKYRGLGFPEHWGLWAAGVIARQHTLQVRTMGVRWATQVDLWSHQDQLSEPLVLWTSGLRPTALPGDHLTNPWLSYEGSARH